jgi:hypothetical protein
MHPRCRAGDRGDELICYVSWLFPLWDAKRQTLVDKIVKTMVIPA